MALVLADRVKETTTTTSTGTVTLLGASTGYQSFAAVGNGNTTYYCIAGQGTSEWEVGIGTYTSSGTTLSRDTVLASSNSGNLVVFSAGTKDVFVTQPATRAVYVSDSTGGIDLVSAGQFTSNIQPITASVAANALTVTLNPTSLAFRSATLGSGTVVNRQITAAVSVVVPSGATLGTVNAVASRVVVLAIDNAGTVELAVVNLAGGNQLDETNLVTTTTISAAADSNNVVYSTTGRTNVAYRVVGFIDSTQTTAGTWATAPSKIQGVGGQALAAMASLGYGQTWQNVTASRALATTYYNTTGKPIQLAFYGNQTGSGAVTVTCGTATNITVSYNAANSTNPFFTFTVPAGFSYVISAAAATLNSWWELR